MDSLYYIISFVVIITIVVFFHELGHYLAAKKCGVKVEKFSIGMGPELFGFNDRHGTRWMFSLIPIGGYVMMLGDNDISSSKSNEEAIKKLSKEEKNMTLESKSNWQKMFVSFCGPFANFVYAFIVMSAVFLFCGIPSGKPEVIKVVQDGPAFIAGLQIGDEILEIDSTPIEKDIQVPKLINSSLNDYIDFKVRRNGEAISLKIKPEEKKASSTFGSEKKVKTIGVAFGVTKYEKTNAFDAIQKSFFNCIDMILGVLNAFGQLFTGKQSVDNLGGFIQMASISGEIAKTGNIVALIMFTVTLSINLGVINLFPLPVVDGGNIVISFIEQIIRRPINKKIMNFILNVGIALLIGLMLFTTINDMAKIGFVKKILNAILY